MLAWIQFRYYQSGVVVTQKPKPLSTIQVNGPIPAAQARSIIESSLREAILDGRLPSGTAVRQQELADLFGVSRMPVREALRQLEAQSLLTVVQHKGAVVAPLITSNAVETYALRSVLEGFALRLSIPLLRTARRADQLRRDRQAQPLVPHVALPQGAQRQAAGPHRA
jgi:DNA-binding GntR family transcriptional regulator